MIKTYVESNAGIGVAVFAVPDVYEEFEDEAVEDEVNIEFPGPGERALDNPAFLRWLADRLEAWDADPRVGAIHIDID